MYISSEEHKAYLRKKKKDKFIVIFFQVLILVIFLGIWEIAARYQLINTFLSSSPSLVVKTFYSLLQGNDLFLNIGVTLYETILSFVIASAIGIFFSTLLWWNIKCANIFAPYLTVLNSLPKVALGPLIIIILGASIKSIIFMALLICVFVSIINIYHDFSQTDPNYITLLKSLGARKKDIYFKVILPANISNIINNLKINLSMAFIGM